MHAWGNDDVGESASLSGFPVSPQITLPLLNVLTLCSLDVLSWLSTKVLTDNRFLLIVSPVRFYTCHETCLKLTLHTLFKFYYVKESPGMNWNFSEEVL
jgi:hypothetical protein